MIRSFFAAFILIATLGANLGNAQQAIQFKNFTSFKQLAPGVDFYASNRQAVAPYEKPASAAIAKLRDLFGVDLPKGAIFICSTLAQKDAVYEPRVIKAGYSWSLTVITADVKAQEMMARMKSMMGANMPADAMAQMKSMQSNMMADMEKQQVMTTIQQISYAVVQTLLVKDLQYRSSRLDDMGKSPLPDWLDIAIASYAADSKSSTVYLQQNIDQTFPLEDILTMARPFVSSSQGGGGSMRSGGGPGGGGGFGGMPPGGFGGQGMPSGGFGGGGFGGQGMPTGGGGGFGGMPPGGFGGQGMPQGGFSGRGMPSGGFGDGGFGGQGMPQSNGGARGQAGAGASPNGGQRGGGQRTFQKDEQDRALFDGQASTFFSYLIDKAGIEKVKELIRQAREGKESREYISKPEVLGSDFGKIEEEWAAWVKSLKS
jgi:hypothetical protein